MKSGVFHSSGERSRVLAFLIVGIFGAAIGFMVALRLGQGAILHFGIRGYDIWMICAGALGSMAALALAGRQFGQPGFRGFLRALLASVWVSFFGSLIGGTLMLPLYGTMFGPFTLAVTLISSPLFAVIWFLNLIGAHLMLSNWQRERDSIFEAFEDGRIDEYREGRGAS